MTIRADGTLARFATESGRLTGRVVKPKLFEPSKALKLTVFGVAGLERNEIIDIGVDVVKAHPTAQRLHGWGEISESDVTDVGLSIDHDDNPPRHANIIDWPTDSSTRKLRRQELASRAHPVRLNSPLQVNR